VINSRTKKCRTKKKEKKIEGEKVKEITKRKI
jgi:hypothetical protein